MVDKGDDPPKRKRRLTPEQIWIRGFLEFYGTENVSRFCRDDLGGVSLIRIVDALLRGEHISSEKCEGPGAVCVFSHESDDDEVEVTVWFEAGEMVLEFRGARKVKEIKSEPDEAA
jgi:hypothetical protein